MQAVRLSEFGPAENLSYEEVADPVPASGRLRIRVEAAGVHLLDTALRAGITGGGPVALPELPTIPGREVAGTVESVGPDVDTSWVGRRVVAHLVGGEPGRQAFDLFGIGGRLVMFGWSAGTPTAVTTDDIVARGLTVSWAIGPKLLRRPGGLPALEAEAVAEAVEGRWKPLTTRFPLSKAADAHEALENRETTGKVVLIP